MLVVQPVISPAIQSRRAPALCMLTRRELARFARRAAQSKRGDREASRQTLPPLKRCFGQPRGNFPLVGSQVVFFARIFR